MSSLFRNKWFLILGVFFLSLRLQAQEGRVPVPKNEDEIKRMMRITYNQHILPEGANKGLLENLLDRGQVIVFYDKPPVVPWMSAAGIMVNAPAEVVFATLSDFEHYNQFVPMTGGAESKKVGENLHDVTFHINVKMAFIKYTMDYGVYHYDRPPYRTDWAHSWGEFNINVGFWELIPTEDGRTMAFYSVYSEPRSKFLKMIFTRAPLVEMMTNVSTAVMVTRATKFEAEKRYKASGGKLVAPKKGKPVFEILSQDPDSMQKFLERGKILVLEDGPTVYVTAGAITSAARDRVWSVITDYLKYPEFMPGAQKVDSLGMGAKGPKYHWEIGMDLAIFDYSFKYDTECILKKPDYVTCETFQEGAQPAQGFSRLIASDGKTLFFNGSTADLRKMGWILSYAVKTEPTLEHALLGCQALVGINALKKEIEKKPKASGK